MNFRPRALALLAVALAVVVAAPRAARAEEPLYPEFTGYVVDAAHVIDPATKAQITQFASQLDHAGFAQLAVCTVPSLGEVSKEEFANELFKRWRLGHGKKADGILVLIVPGGVGHRQIKIEIGYGMEALLNDGRVGEILDQQAVPHLLQDDYAGAALAVSERVSQIVNGDAAGGGVSRPGGTGATHRSTPDELRARQDEEIHRRIDQAERDVGVGGLGLAVAAMCLLLGVLLSSASRRHFPGAGTGVFAAALIAGTALGVERLGGSAGWIALACGAAANGLAYWSIRSRKCPKCGAWLDVSHRVVRKPTYASPGLAETTERCTRCGYDNVTTHELPRKQRGVIVAGGGGWGGGGGGWGGGGGGDSGGGFSGGGGGDSGGGGAGRSV